MEPPRIPFILLQVLHTKYLKQYILLEIYSFYYKPYTQHIPYLEPSETIHFVTSDNQTLVLSATTSHNFIPIVRHTSNGTSQNSIHIVTSPAHKLLNILEFHSYRPAHKQRNLPEFHSHCPKSGTQTLEPSRMPFLLLQADCRF